MKYYIELIKDDGFYYISYSNEDMLDSIEGGAFYIDFNIQDGRLCFTDVFHNTNITKKPPTYLLNYIKFIESTKLEDVKEKTLNFFSGKEVIYSEQIY